MGLSTRDRRFLFLCNEVREGSHDPDRKVGVVIADNAGQILAAGTNAPPPSLGLTVEKSHDAILQDTSWKYFMLEHAERNAIFTAYSQGKSLAGATMYGTLYPCADCARAIVAAGLTRLVVFDLTKDPVRDAKWLDHHHHAERIFSLAAVAVEIVNPADTGTSGEK